MGLPDTGPRVARFGVFELDLRTGELRRKGLKVALQEQPFRVLAMLVARPGELVTRDELRRALWPDAVFVDFDHGLNKAVGKIRRALGDLAGSARFVETLERRGYRFIAPVESVSGAAPSLPIAAAPERVVRFVGDDRAIPLADGTHFIGRDPASAIRIDSPVVSRRHARVVIGASGVTLEDLGSHNGTFVNGDRIDAVRRLADGDEIRVGPARFVVHLATGATTLTDASRR
jgi:DNA-binding winged helix-turn-helix (wHTH) protein